MMMTGHGRFVRGRGGCATGGSGDAALFSVFGKAGTADVAGTAGAVGAVATAVEAKRPFLTTLTVYLSSLATGFYAAYSIQLHAC